MIADVDKILSVVSLLVTLVTFLLNLVWPEIQAVLNAAAPDTSKKNERRKARERAQFALWIYMAPIAVAFLALFYTNLPKAVNVVEHSSFDPWNFDQINTLYVLLECVLVAFCLFTLFYLYKLVCKVVQLNG